MRKLFLILLLLPLLGSAQWTLEVDTMVVDHCTILGNLSYRNSDTLLVVSNDTLYYNNLIFYDNWVIGEDGAGFQTVDDSDTLDFVEGYGVNISMTKSSDYITASFSVDTTEVSKWYEFDTDTITADYNIFLDSTFIVQSKGTTLGNYDWINKNDSTLIMYSNQSPSVYSGLAVGVYNGVPFTNTVVTDGIQTSYINTKPDCITLYTDSLVIDHLTEADGGYFLSYNTTSNEVTAVDNSGFTNYWSLSGSDIYYNTGDVSINTTSPGIYNLNVNGSIYGSPLYTNQIKMVNSTTGITFMNASGSERAKLTNTLFTVEVNTEITGDLSTTGYIRPDKAIHLFAYFGDSTITFPYTTAWQHLTNDYDSAWIYKELDGFTWSNDSIFVTEAGDYNLDAGVTLSGDANETVSIRFFNVTQTAGIPVAGAVTARGAANFNTIPVTSYTDITAGDTIVLQIKGDASGSAIFKNSIIRIIKVHE